MTKSLDPNILSQFTGSEHWYRHGLVRSILFTDGAKYVADAAGAYWLLDEIALAQCFVKAVAAEEFQVWKLTVKPDNAATLTCEDGNTNVGFTKAIESFNRRSTLDRVITGVRRGHQVLDFDH